MSFQAVQDRLAALQETTAQLQELIARLAHLDFQPGSVPLDAPLDGSVSAELSAEILETLRDQDEDLELLEQQILDLPDGQTGSDAERDKKQLTEGITKTLREHRACHVAFRRAQLTAKRNLEAAQRVERRLLLQTLANPPPAPTDEANASTTAPPPPLRRSGHSLALRSKDEKLVDAATDVTAALRRTHALMSTELSRSQFAHDTLRESTAALAQLGDSYDSLDALLASSRNLVKTLLTSQKTDTWYLETAVYVLLATIAWLVFRRFIYGPAWWLVWLPLKLFFKAWMGVFAALGLRPTDATVTVGYEEVVQEALSAATAAAAVTTSAIPVQHKIGTRKSKPPPGWQSNPPYVRVGGGGRHYRDGSEPSMVDTVGQIIDESREVEQEAEPVVEPNPYKRMWEGDGEPAAQSQKDEL